MSELPTLPSFDELRAMGTDDLNAWALRREWVKTKAWFLLSQETADTLATYLKPFRVVEMGAGSGYLAAHMRRLGVSDYRAYDSYCLRYFDRKKDNYGVKKRSTRSISFKQADVIVLTWPTYNTSFADHVARKMHSGQILIYQGVRYGCTGDDRFHHRLDAEFTELPNITVALKKYHIQWFGIHDNWYVLQKN